MAASVSSGRPALEACFQIEGLCAELLELAPRIRAADCFQLYATVNALAGRIQAPNHVAIQFLNDTGLPIDDLWGSDLPKLHSIVFLRVDYAGR